jgi:hypothetical protein
MKIGIQPTMMNFFELHGRVFALKGSIEIQTERKCLLIKQFSDLLSEFHQPRSGILHIMDEMRFPSLGQAPIPANLAFLAEISMRLLLNRIHYSIYSTDSLQEVPNGSLISTCTELDRQLNNWHDPCLPRFSLISHRKTMRIYRLIYSDSATGLLKILFSGHLCSMSFLNLQIYIFLGSFWISASFVSQAVDTGCWRVKSFSRSTRHGPTAH